MAKAPRSVSGTQVREHWLDQCHTAKAVTEKRKVLEAKGASRRVRHLAKGWSVRETIELIAQEERMGSAFMDAAAEGGCITIIPPYVS